MHVLLFTFCVQELFPSGTQSAFVVPNSCLVFHCVATPQFFLITLLLMGFKLFSIFQYYKQCLSDNLNIYVAQDFMVMVFEEGQDEVTMMLQGDLATPVQDRFGSRYI